MIYNPTFNPYIAENCSYTEEQFNREHFLPPSTLTVDGVGGRHDLYELIPALRSAAQQGRQGNPQEIILRAVVEFANNPGGDNLLGNALADLAVTGSSAYKSFRRTPPDAVLLLPMLRSRLNGANYTDDVLNSAINRALDRAYRVAWAIDGPVQYREDNRPSLGWICVSGDDDAPHRPVNIPSGPYPQYNVVVPVSIRNNGQVVSIPVITRVMVATSTGDDEGVSVPDPQSSIRRLPVSSRICIPPQDEILVYVHGHSSRAEEANDVIPYLQRLGKMRGKSYSIISFDQPSCGYSSMIEHTEVAPSGDSRYPGSYPILQFIENHIVSLILTIDRQTRLTNRIAAIIGGSLGGNMALRLAKRNDLTWLKKLASWSAASIWGESWARASSIDIVRAFGVNRTRERMNAEEEDIYIPPIPNPILHPFNQREAYFKLFFGTGEVEIVVELGRYADRWYRDGWPCKELFIEGGRHERKEVYNREFRRWQWRVAHEQLIFMHTDSNELPENRIDQVIKPLLLGAGERDNHRPEYLYDRTRDVVSYLVNQPGSSFFIGATGHSIHNERPQLLADQILRFIDQKPAINQDPAQILVNRLVVVIKVGADNLREGSRAFLRLTGADNSRLTYEIPLTNGEELESNKVYHRSFELETPVLLSQIQAINIRGALVYGSANLDEWDLHSIIVQFHSYEHQGILYSGIVSHRFPRGRSVFSLPVNMNLIQNSIEKKSLKVAVRFSGNRYMSVANNSIRAVQDRIGNQEIIEMIYVDFNYTNPQSIGRYNAVWFQTANGSFITLNDNGTGLTLTARPSERSVFLVSEEITSSGRQRIGILAANNRFLGIGTDEAGPLLVDAQSLGSSERIRIINLENETVFKITAMEDGRKFDIHGTGNEIADSQEVTDQGFRLISLGSGAIRSWFLGAGSPSLGLFALQSRQNGLFVRIDTQNGRLRADSEVIGPDETFEFDRNSQDGSIIIGTPAEGTPFPPTQNPVLGPPRRYWVFDSIETQQSNDCVAYIRITESAELASSFYAYCGDTPPNPERCRPLWLIRFENSVIDITERLEEIRRRTEVYIPQIPPGGWADKVIQSISFRLKGIRFSDYNKLFRKNRSRKYELIPEVYEDIMRKSWVKDIQKDKQITRYVVGLNSKESLFADIKIQDQNQQVYYFKLANAEEAPKYAQIAQGLRLAILEIQIPNTLK